MKIFALVVDNEVINVFHFGDLNPYKERYINGLSSNPFFINASKYSDIKVGDYYIDNNFYSADNLEDSLLQSDILINTGEFPVSKFCAISNDQVFGIIVISSIMPEHDLIVAGMSSNPDCIDASEYPDIEIGWIWNGEIFSPPQAE